MIKKKNVDIIIDNGTILTIDKDDKIISNGSIAIDNGRIIELGESIEIKDRYLAKEEINANGCVVMPGLINTHTHSAMSIFRGLADDMPLEKWLNDYIFPLEDKFVDEKFCYWGSMLACIEMIMSGTTTFCDMYFFEKETGLAAEKLKMRAVIGEGIATIGKDENKALDNKINLTKELLEKFKDNPLISIAVEPHSCYTCSKNVLIRSKEFEMNNNLLYAIHLSETKEENKNIRNEFAMSPVEYLNEIGVLDKRTIAAHCVWLSDKDIDILKSKEAKVSHCPASNMKLASGVAPVDKMLSADLVVGLGTDSCASNNNLDMFSEINTAAELAKVSTLNAAACNSKEAIRMA